MTSAPSWHPGSRGTTIPEPIPDETRRSRPISLFGAEPGTALKVAWGFFIAHVFALVFGLLGLLVAIPNPDLWVGSESGRQVYEWGMNYGGATHIVLAAIAVFALGVASLGWTRTAIFLALSVGLSAGSELIGTGTGWPFGNYEYTDYLGYRLLDRVPFTIPLSWFYMGLACYLFARIVVAFVGRRLGPVGIALWTIGLGAYFVVVWDLVLDPAMAHEDMTIVFWTWHETGPYFGMPIQNYVGWAMTAIAYIGLSRLLWGREADPTRIPAALPTLVILANLIFASVLSLSVGLWIPVILAFGLTLLPVWYFWRVRTTTSPDRRMGLSPLSFLPDQ